MNQNFHRGLQILFLGVGFSSIIYNSHGNAESINSTDLNGTFSGVFLSLGFSIRREFYQYIHIGQDIFSHRVCSYFCSQQRTHQNMTQFAMTNSAHKSTNSLKISLHNGGICMWSLLPPSEKIVNYFQLNLCCAVPNRAENPNERYRRISRKQIELSTYLEEFIQRSYYGYAEFCEEICKICSRIESDIKRWHHDKRESGWWQQNGWQGSSVLGH